MLKKPLVGFKPSTKKNFYDFKNLLLNVENYSKVPLYQQYYRLELEMSKNLTKN